MRSTLQQILIFRAYSRDVRKFMFSFFEKLWDDNQNNFIMRKAVLYLMIGHCFFHTSYGRNDGYLNCVNKVGNDKVGISVVCSGTRDEPQILPNSIPNNVESLIMNVTNITNQITIPGIDFFKTFTKLKILRIYTTGSLLFTPKLDVADKWKRAKRELFNLSSLEEFTWSQKIRTEDYDKGWMLPSNLKSASFIGNVPVDLTRCHNIMDLSFSDCQLSKMSQLRNVNPLLKMLNLSDCDLTSFTVNEIARFCKLEVLIMMRVNLSSCECIRVKEWIKEVSTQSVLIFISDLSCRIVQDADCTKFTLNDAEKLRSSCLLINQAHAGVFSYNWAVVVVIVVPVLMLSCFLTYRWRRRRRRRRIPKDDDGRRFV